MVSDDRAEKALAYLARTDSECAVLKADLARYEYAAKLARARMFLLSDKGSVEARKADAETSKDVRDADSKVADGIEAYESMRAKRQTEELVVEVFRTISANRRHGNI